MSDGEWLTLSVVFSFPIVSVDISSVVFSSVVFLSSFDDSSFLPASVSFLTSSVVTTASVFVAAISEGLFSLFLQLVKDKINTTRSATTSVGMLTISFLFFDIVFLITIHLPFVLFFGKEMFLSW